MKDKNRYYGALRSVYCQTEGCNTGCICNNGCSYCHDSACQQNGWSSSSNNCICQQNPGVYSRNCACQQSGSCGNNCACQQNGCQCTQNDNCQYNGSDNNGSACGRQNDRCGCGESAGWHCVAAGFTACGGCGCGKLNLTMNGGDSGCFTECPGGVRIEKCGRYAAFYVFEKCHCTDGSGARCLMLNSAELSSSRSWGGMSCGQAIFSAGVGDVLALTSGSAVSGGPAARIIIVKMD